MALTDKLEHWLGRLFTGLAMLAAVCGVFIIVLVCSSVFMRHLAHSPFRFTEELVGLLMTSAFFLALPLVTFNARHVRVQILVTALPHRFIQPVALVAAALGVVFTIWFMLLCWPWFEFGFKREIKTEVGRLLMYPWMAVVPISMFLTAVAFALRAFQSSFKLSGHSQS